MAEPAAVPGVDPSRVNTPGELAACLEGLRLRRGLSYEAMEREAARLRSRPGGSRLERLPKSTVGDIVTGKRPPTKGKLLTFLAVCEVAPADLAQWLAAWERAITADLARPAGAVQVRDARPDLLGVHKAISVPGIPDEVLPQYVPRDVDAAEFGIRARVRAAARRGGFVLLVGGSSVGKTRCAFEAVKTLLPEWWLVHPAGPAEVSALAQAPPPRTVVWLDELQRYLDVKRGLTGGTVRALLASPNPIVIVSTLWPDLYAAYTALPEPDGPDPHAREREVLDLADVVRIGSKFSEAERGRAHAAAERDRWLAVALESAGYGLTQTLAAAPQLVARWEDAQDVDPYAWAVLTAALDAARLGARAPLSADLLYAAAPGYCTSQQQAEAPGDWFEQALAYATKKLHGAAAALSPAGAGMGHVAGYTAADYLIQHASRERRGARVPASTWDALLRHVHDATDARRLAESAELRLLYCCAIPLYEYAADSGDERAAALLARLLAARGDLNGLSARAEAANRAGWHLARVLAEHGDLDQLRARADTGDLYAAEQLAYLLADRGDLDGALQILRTRADAGDRFAKYAAEDLVKLLAENGDLDQLRARADTGDLYAAGRLAGLLAENGDLDEALQLLRTCADAGDRDAANQLPSLLAKHGDLDEALQILRARADTGNMAAAQQLAHLLAEHGDLDQLRARADTGDIYAAEQLAGLLAARGDLDEALQILRARADAGDRDAANQLASLLVQRGDLDQLRARADAGDHHAAMWLAARGDPDQLRARADADDHHAAGQLADLLAKRGDLDEALQILRAQADAGNGDAERLAQLLTRQGQEEEAERIRRFGLVPDGWTVSGEG